MVTVGGGVIVLFTFTVSLCVTVVPQEVNGTEITYSAESTPVPRHILLKVAAKLEPTVVAVVVESTVPPIVLNVTVGAVVVLVGVNLQASWVTTKLAPFLAVDAGSPQLEHAACIPTEAFPEIVFSR